MNWTMRATLAVIAEVEDRPDHGRYGNAPMRLGQLAAWLNFRDFRQHGEERWRTPFSRAAAEQVCQPRFPVRMFCGCPEDSGCTGRHGQEEGR